MDRYPARREPKGSSHPLAPTQAAGERDRDSRRPAPRLGGRNSVVWLSWSSVLQTARSTKPPNATLSGALVSARPLERVVGWRDAKPRTRHLAITGYWEPGSMPFALIVRAASGAKRYLINAAAVSASLVETPTPAQNTKSVVFWRSAGSGPTSSTPGTPRTTMGCTIASSASRFARISAYSEPGTSVVFDFISAVMPSRSITRAAWIPVAPPFVGSG